MLGFAFGVGILLYWASVAMAPHGSLDVFPLMLRILPWMLLMLPVAGFFSFVQVAVMEPPPGETRLGRIFKFWITVAFLTDSIITFFYVLGGGIEGPRNTRFISESVQSGLFAVGAVIGLLAIAVFVLLGLFGFVSNASSELGSVARGTRDWWRQ